ncbi:MAG: pumilio domain member 6 [Chrysothrix sp. TS-e1954]|nr:MAG: pumilio domain member 6 [Chrysothrix sp. TS-e1954]
MSAIKRRLEPESNSRNDSSKRRKSDSARGNKVVKPSVSIPEKGKADELADPKKANIVSELYDTKSSKEAHLKQRTVARERKASKPNADSIARAKKIWERLRRKSHVPLEERKTLVDELFSIITGHINDFVFKHDSVRPVQCALKYANAEQRRAIAQELRGQFKTLAQSRYAKFLVAKILAEPDKVVRGWVLSEFEGSVRKLINHPEASWILDDSYRAVASPLQRRRLLREWYGAEFAIFKQSEEQHAKDAKIENEQVDLLQVLEANPEKRKPILSNLHGMINQLIQKKMTAFTMLHDAMLQYSIAVGHPSTSPAAAEFLEMLKPASANTDEQDYESEKDILLNLAFTPSGSRVVARAFAVSNAKDRKVMLRVFKNHIETMACDVNAYSVLLAASETIDDTVMTSKMIFPELLATKTEDIEERCSAICALANHQYGRIPLLWALATASAELPTSLVPPGSSARTLITGVRELRVETSKKEPEKRRAELAQALSEYDGILLKTIQSKAEELVQTAAGCQFITEVLLNIAGENTDAVTAVAVMARGDPNMEDHFSKSPAAGKMLRTLILGGHYDAKQGQIAKAHSDLKFADPFWGAIKEHATAWASGASSFTVVNLLEAEQFASKDEVKAVLKNGKRDLDAAAEKGNKGAQILLQKM